MKNYSRLLNLNLYIFLSIISIQTRAQDNHPNSCGTMNHLYKLKKMIPALTGSMLAIEEHTSNFISTNRSVTGFPIVSIPVVFHILYNTSTQNISDAQCIAQINQLNLDYAKLNADFPSTPDAFKSVAADTKIQFCLAQRDPNGNATSGIIHKFTSMESFSDNDKMKSNATGGDDIWDRSKYLNIWICNLESPLIGYAQLPGGPASTDGVVLLHSVVGSVSSPSNFLHYNMGRTGTHEVGHWLNLLHIWGDDTGACSGSDLVSDTPNQAGENYNCPTFPLTDACNNVYPGVMFMNYMNYVDDNCMRMFTNGQGLRMQALFSAGGFRESIKNSNGCEPLTPVSFSMSSASPISVICGTVEASGIISTTATTGFNTPIILSADNNPAPTNLLFLKNPLDPGGSTTFTIQHMNFVAPGSYQFTMFGTAGINYQSLPLTIQVTPSGTPILSEHPKHTISGKGGIAHFSVQSNFSDTYYQWQDSTGTHDWQNIIGATTATYSLSDITKDMSGNRYRVIAQSVCGLETSQSADLEVIELSVYPNPNRGIFDISSFQKDKNNILREADAMIIYDQMGTKIFQSKKNEGSGSFHCELKTIQTGVYRIVLINETGEIITVIPVLIDPNLK